MNTAYTDQPATPVVITASPVLGTSGASSATITTDHDIPAGSTILLVAATRVTAGAIVTSVSGGSLSWTVDVTKSVSGTSTGLSVARAYCTTLLASGTTLTVTFDATHGRRVIQGFHLVGLANRVPDQSAVTNGTTTTTSGSISRTHHDRMLLLAAWSRNAAAGTDSGAPFDDTVANPGSERWGELLDAIAGSSSWCHAYVQWTFANGSGVYSTSFTPTTQTANNGCLVAYRIVRVTKEVYREGVIVEQHLNDGSAYFAGGAT